jgi:hypothetical protein
VQGRKASCGSYRVGNEKLACKIFCSTHNIFDWRSVSMVAQFEFLGSSGFEPVRLPIKHCANLKLQKQISGLGSTKL